MATRALICITGLLLLCGCAPKGILYTNVVYPFSSKFNATPVGSKECSITDHQVKEPFTGRGIRAEWTRGRIRKEARKAGMEDIHYMDLRTQSFLFDIYKREIYIAHGD